MTHDAEPHEAEIHDEAGGHDVHDAHDAGAPEFGPVDLPLWGAFILGVVLGVVPALGISLAISV